MIAGRSNRPAGVIFFLCCLWRVSILQTSVQKSLTEPDFHWGTASASSWLKQKSALGMCQHLIQPHFDSRLQSADLIMIFKMSYCGEEKKKKKVPIHDLPAICPQNTKWHRHVQCWHFVLLQELMRSEMLIQSLCVCVCACVRERLGVID